MLLFPSVQLYSVFLAFHFIPAGRIATASYPHRSIMSSRDRRSVLDKLVPVSAPTIHSLQTKRKTALVALGGVLLVGCFLIVYNLTKEDSLSSHNALVLYKARKDACEKAVSEGTVSFWLNHMRDDKIACQMYAEAYYEMVGEVGHGVPKIIHQSWKTADVTDDFRVWSSSWQKANPDHEYWFWTDEDNRDMVKTYYPEFLETYGTGYCRISPRVSRFLPHAQSTRPLDRCLRA